MDSLVSETAWNCIVKSFGEPPPVVGSTILDAIESECKLSCCVSIIPGSLYPVSPAFCIMNSPT